MKKLILTLVVAAIASISSFGQIYQHDFQKIIGLPYDGVTNYTLEKTRSGGYAIAGIVEEYGANGINQRTIVMFVTDSEFNVISSLFSTAEADQYGNLFVPQDIHETTSGNFIVCGVVLQESATANGGFLMHVNNDRRDGLMLDWINVYLNSNSGGNSSVSILNRVVETSTGYMAIGQSKYGPTTKGIVIGTDYEGEMLWSKLLYDNQYGTNYQSVLNDMVRIDETNVGIVGTVNSFTIDDADIYVVVLDENGNVVNERVYERFGKKYGDGQPAFLEKGRAIAYNEERRALIIAGTATQKAEGQCVEADFRRLLTLEVNLHTLNLNWSRMYEINADLEIATVGLSCEDIAYDALSDQYAVTGTVRNDAFSTANSENGFVLRLNPAGISTNLRYYGTEEPGRLNKIYADGITAGTFAACGMTRNDSKNYAWAVKSYQTIEDDCHSTPSLALTDNYPLQTQNGIAKKVRVAKNFTRCENMIPLTEEETFCETILTAGSPLRPNQVTENETVVYPKIMKNSTPLFVENNKSYNTYSLYNPGGSRVIQSGVLNEGHNSLNFDQLTTGVYILRLESNEKQETLKIVIE